MAFGTLNSANYQSEYVTTKKKHKSIYNSSLLGGKSLRRKMLMIFLPVTLVPLAIAGTLGGIITYQRSSEQKESQLHDRAVTVAELTSKELELKFAILQTVATDPLIIKAVRDGSEQIEQEGLEKLSIEELENKFKETKLLSVDILLNSYLQRIAKIGNFAEIFFTERYGLNIAYSQRTSDFIQRNEDWWQNGKEMKRFISKPHLDESTNTFNFDLVNRIVDPDTQEFLGTIKAGYETKELSFLADELHKIELLGSEYLQIISIKDRAVVTTMNNTGATNPHYVLGGDVLLKHAAKWIQARKNKENTKVLSHTTSFVHANRRFTLAQIPDTDWIVVASIELGEIHASANQMLLIFGVIFLILGTVASVVIMKFSRALSKPLNQLTITAREVTDKSDFNLRVPVTTQDEVGVLGIHFNKLIRWIAKYTQELQETQAQLIHSEKMSSLGQMLAGVVHEINNPVNFIHGNIQYAGEYSQDLLKLIEIYQQHCPPLASEVQDQVEAIDPDFVIQDFSKLLNSMQVGTERIIEIVNSLRTFSRLDEADIKEMDIHEGIDSTLMMLQSRLKENKSSPSIEVIKDYGDIPLVECCPGQINQVFMNILANAIDALKESYQSKKPASTQEFKHQEPPNIHLQTKQENKNCIITIADNGSGMTQEVQRRIFDPFFTTKSVGKGTGLGLSISYKIVVEKHQGKLECDSILNKGTKFTIALPLKAVTQ